MLPEEALLEFKVVYKKRFGVELEPKELSYLANSFINGLKVVCRTVEDLKVGPKEDKIKEPPIK